MLLALFCRRSITMKKLVALIMLKLTAMKFGILVKLRWSTTGISLLLLDLLWILRCWKLRRFLLIFVKFTE